jgi:branched-chain amino acid transport system permease protein
MVAFVLFLVVLPFTLKNSFYVDVAIRIAVNAVLVIALNLLVGYAGQISIGHAGFYGIGAYGSAILTTRVGMQPLPALVVSALGASCLAWLVARVILRLKGHYLAMATLGLGMIIAIVITNEAAWTGGPDGISLGEFAAFGRSLSGEQEWYWVFAILLVIAIVLAQNLIDSPAGRALQALNGSDIAAKVVGIDTSAFKTRVFVVSAAVTAVIVEGIGLRHHRAERGWKDIAVQFDHGHLQAVVRLDPTGGR